MNTKKNLSKALIKKAIGLSVDEVIEEYAQDEETKDLKLIKKKVTKKQLPPDIQAVRALMEINNYAESDAYTKMTDEELLKERDKLIDILKKEGESSDANN